MGELEECGWKKAEEKKEAEVCRIKTMHCNGYVDDDYDTDMIKLTMTMAE